MRTFLKLAAASVMVGVGSVSPVMAADCPEDSVRAGTVCVDKYEASMWYVPPQEKKLIGKIQEGKVTLADLTAAAGGGVVQVGVVSGDFVSCNSPLGNGCVDVYAVSVPGVMPTSWATWFQAAAAARNSLKRLPTNQEWQVAAFGTPDPNFGPSPCNVNGAGPALTGSASGCVSDVGVFDMVGNVAEMVADWGDHANGCVINKTSFGADRSCVGGAGVHDSPTTTRHIASNYLRGGDWDDGFEAGPLAMDVNTPAGLIGSNLRGFRCVR
jgi:formylglycine-generating enzyme required for sulfatase activity